MAREASRAEIERILRETGAIREGHFLLTSGLHSPTYLEKFRILQYPQPTEYFCRLIAEHFRSSGAQVVAGPTTGGIILAYEVARQLGVRGIFAEKEGGGRAFKRAFSLSPGERVLVVDDVLTTGGSLQEVLEAVGKGGAPVVGVGVMLDRSLAPPDFGVPFFACYRLPIPTYRPQECPLCAQGLPLERHGIPLS